MFLLIRRNTQALSPFMYASCYTNKTILALTTELVFIFLR